MQAGQKPGELVGVRGLDPGLGALFKEGLTDPIRNRVALLPVLLIVQEAGLLAFGFGLRGTPATLMAECNVLWCWMPWLLRIPALDGRLAFSPCLGHC